MQGHTCHQQQQVVHLRASCMMPCAMQTNSCMGCLLADRHAAVWRDAGTSIIWLAGTDLFLLLLIVCSSVPFALALGLLLLLLPRLLLHVARCTGTHAISKQQVVHR